MATEKTKRLKEFSYPKQSKATRKYALRMIKLLRPICDECSPLGRGWVDQCSHDPYHRLKPVTVRTEQRHVDPVTGLVTKTEEQVKVSHWMHVPNIVQVPLTMRIDSGFSVEAALAKGFKHPEDVQPTLATGEADPDYDGYAPMCEYQNCYKTKPHVRARHAALEENRQIPVDSVNGHYCSEMHARLAKQKDSETLTIEVNDAAKRREQLEAISLP